MLRSHNGRVTVPSRGRSAGRSKIKARSDAGGKQIAVMLSPAAAAKLAKWKAQGETVAGVVSKLLERSVVSQFEVSG